MTKIQDIINRLWNVCGQMEVGALLTCGSGIKKNKCYKISVECCTKTRPDGD